MKKLFIGFVLGVVVVVGGAVLYFGLGLAPVATADPAMPFEKLLAGMALHSRIAKEGSPQAPIPPDEANLLAGARVYQTNCAVCHGVSSQAETAIAKGMFPHPPQLFTGHGVTDDPPGETHWKAANGIRLTGMPGFKASLSDTELWQVSLLLANADKLSPAVKTALGAAPPAK